MDKSGIILARSHTHASVFPCPNRLPQDPWARALETVPEILHVLHELLHAAVGQDVLRSQRDSRQRVERPALLKVGRDARPVVGITRFYKNDGVAHELHGDGALELGHDVGGLEPLVKGHAVLHGRRGLERVHGIRRGLSGSVALILVLVVVVVVTEYRLGVGKGMSAYALTVPCTSALLPNPSHKHTFTHSLTHSLFLFDHMFFLSRASIVKPLRTTTMTHEG